MRFYREVVIPHEEDDCLIWPYGRCRRGYGKLRFDGRNQYVSRLVCEDENGPPPTPKHEAAHSCGKGSSGCVARRHLTWKTAADNNADKFGHGTVLYGAGHPSAKLGEDEVRRIREMRGVAKVRDIAKIFGVSKSLVRLLLLLQRSLLGLQN